MVAMECVKNNLWLGKETSLRVPKQQWSQSFHKRSLHSLKNVVNLQQQFNWRKVSQIVGQNLYFQLCWTQVGGVSDPDLPKTTCKYLQKVTSKLSKK